LSSSSVQFVTAIFLVILLVMWFYWFYQFLLISEAVFFIVYRSCPRICLQKQNKNAKMLQSPVPLVSKP